MKEIITFILRVMANDEAWRNSLQKIMNRIVMNIREYLITGG